MAIDDPSSLRIGKVVLTVHDIDRVGRFYREVVGLRDLGRDGDILRLGTGTTILIELRRDAQARFRSPRDAGLFHTAFLLPSRADLGRWTRHAAQERFRIEGVADHGVSEALYLSDPEGNGVEIYSDRPRSTWEWTGGTLAMRTDPLDTDALMRDAGPTAWDGVPEGTTVGHVHLQVGAIAPAEAFYEGVLGVPLTARYPGGSFFGSDRYHHHFGANIWNSRNAGPRTAPATGLADVGIDVADAATLDAIERRATEAGGVAVRHGSVLSLRDPWGTSLTLKSPEA